MTTDYGAKRAGGVGGRAQVNILVTGAKGMVGTAPVQQPEKHPGQQEIRPARHCILKKSTDMTWILPLSSWISTAKKRILCSIWLV